MRHRKVKGASSSGCGGARYPADEPRENGGLITNAEEPANTGAEHWGNPNPPVLRHRHFPGLAENQRVLDFTKDPVPPPSKPVHY
eukprot:CAMPEP_0172582772 /NCGR_PEP_ID=MMETSP1068-20121228/2305_1 /TAXON_ID=35684 /ORGANISM="Pseudopedinella elastica, Strain CCMP716" /LENGTH=84 /DNA_ID=CAMNT_0013376305 /DNA_START=136 /DNA_END=389 /DNA_ORIENTATION=+